MNLRFPCLNRKEPHFNQRRLDEYQEGLPAEYLSMWKVITTGMICGVRIQ